MFEIVDHRDIVILDKTGSAVIHRVHVRYPL